MTLTTETLNDFIAGRGFGVAPSAVEAMARELLANREAQPVGYIDPDSLKEYRGQRAGGTWSAVQRTTSGLNMTTPIYTAPPAPSNAQVVAWEMRYWNSGHGCWHDWESITAEQYAEMSVQHATDNDYEFRALYDAPPVRAVPDELLDAMEEVIRISNRDHEAWDKAKAAITACRAAMLAQPVSSGYRLPDGWKLVPVEPTEEMLRAAYRESGIYSAKAYRATLAAAPEGGN
ncbi:hypothetical protein [Serratia marcescens]|uniref:hypothetical protein n=1 Tax=Serratia marcescens TaxID=615 RepID=UPI00149569AE|nr:hypothetical protein [Serratia marcescens]